jgi:hypothetical protein
MVSYGIRVVSKYLNVDSLRILYHANFESVIRYAIIFWGSSQDTKRIFVTQKRTLRVIYKMGYRESCRGVFKTKNIFTVYGLFIYECLVFFFKYQHSIFQDTHPNHQYPTRNHIRYLPKHNLTLTENSAYYMSIKIFNSLPNNIKGIISLNNFKKAIKKLIIEAEPYSLEEFLNRQ